MLITTIKNDSNNV
jgi:hypothetical protein